MEFSGQYLTFEQYKALGGALDRMPFELLEYETRKKIDERTQNRLKNVEDIPQEVKMCMFKLMGVMSSYDEGLDSVSRNIASENTDGYSVSYVTGSQIQEVLKTKNKELDDIIMTYLNGVIVNGEHILFLGVN
jgi:hypothetical protein